MKHLEGKLVAILATSGFEQSELLEPKKALEKAGATVEVIAPEAGEIAGWSRSDWADSVLVEKTLDEVVPIHYDALLLPGGVLNADKLRTDRKAVEFVRQIIEAGKPIAAICHAPWILIETGLVRGKNMTSWPSLQTDLRNAGVNWTDEEVITDQGLVTSRKPEDIPAFNKKFIEEILGGGRARNESDLKRASGDRSY